MAPHDRQVLPCIGGLCIGEPSGCSGELTGVIVVNFSGLLANSARRRRIASKSSAMRVMMESFLPDVGGAVAPRFRAGVFGTAAAQAADSAGSKRQPQRAIRTCWSCPHRSRGFATTNNVQDDRTVPDAD
jgi:hypothetical protein